MTYQASKKQVFVDIISPGSAIDFAELKAIENFLKGAGFLCDFSSKNKLLLDKKTNHEFSSFSAKERFLQLQDAIYNDKSDVIWCAKGGYGSIELVAFLENLKKPKKEKLFIGFSDITIFNKALIEKLGWKVIIAPMLSQIIQKTVEPEAIKTITDLALGKIKNFEYNLECLLGTDKKIQGIIDGGCLSVLASQFGTKNQIDFKNKILFLEDEGESGERIDRCFSQILQIITETKNYPKAILLGNFFQENVHGNIKQFNIETAISRLVERVKLLNKDIAIFRDVEGHFGHSKKMRPLILGLESQIINSTLLRNGIRSLGV